MILGRTVRRAAAVLLAAALIGASGCGLSPDAEPRVIGEGDLPPDLASPSTSSTLPTTSSPTTSPITVYYLIQQDGVARLHPVTRDVERADRPRDRLKALLTPPTEAERAAGILTSIPSDTILINSELVAVDQELIVDLSRSLFDVQGQELRNAFAQIVWTATELDGVRRVRFLVDGEEFRAPDENGIEQAGAVARSDYLTLSP